MISTNTKEYVWFFTIPSSLLTKHFYGPSVPHSSGYLSRISSVRWDDWDGRLGSIKGDAVLCLVHHQHPSNNSYQRKRGQQSSQKHRNTDQLLDLENKCPKSFWSRGTQPPNYVACLQGVRSLFKAKTEWPSMQLASAFSSVKWGVAQTLLGSSED